MIVNTAYPFMIEKKPAANPNLWENGVVNYPYTVTGDAVFQSASNRFHLKSNTAVRITIPVKGFSKIKIRATGSYAGAALKVSIPRNQNEMSISLSSSEKEIVYNIPDSVKNLADAELQMLCTVNWCFVNSATLEE